MPEAKRWRAEIDRAIKAIRNDVKLQNIINMNNVKVIGVIWLTVHFLSMVIYPTYYYSLDWTKIQNVWDRWQTLNAAMVALASGLIAFQITVYREEKQRQRNFVAARSFLPEEFSALTTYCKQSTEIYKEAYKKIPSDPLCPSYSATIIETNLTTTIPTLPQGHKRIFQDCISQADSEVAQYLSYILMRLQVHNSRMVALHEECGPRSSLIVSKRNIFENLFIVSEIQCLINKNFDYVRGVKEFDNSALSCSDHKNALLNLKIYLDEFDGLENFIGSKIKRKLTV